MLGSEKDIITLKMQGEVGDFVLYEKNYLTQGDDSGYRIAFLKANEGTHTESVVRKIRILKTESKNRGRQGFCMEHEPCKWFDSLDALINTYKDDPASGMLKPFDVSIYSTKTLSPFLKKSLSRSSPDILKRVNDHDRITSPNRAINKFHESREMSHSLSDINNPNIDRVHFNENNVSSLLTGKPEGTYVIHKGKENSEQKPFDVYVNSKYSNKTGKLRIDKHPIHKYQNELFLIGNDQTLRYDSLKQLIIGNRSKFRTPLESSFAGSKPNLFPSQQEMGDYIDTKKMPKQNYRYVYLLGLFLRRD